MDSSHRAAPSSTRRAFIGRTAGVAGAALWAGPKSLRPARAFDDALAITLRSAVIQFEPSQGAAYPMKAFNGSLPGPVIRVRAGSRVRILYRNDSGAAGTIHWHELILPNAMDGVEGITQPLVRDGGLGTTLASRRILIGRGSGPAWYP
ncbi:MAG: multicopper oxidase domain-containing protein [Candidatus Cybelea sp.]